MSNFECPFYTDFTIFNVIVCICMRAEQALARLCECTVSPDPWLYADAISAKIVCAGTSILRLNTC